MASSKRHGGPRPAPGAKPRPKPKPQPGADAKPQAPAKGPGASLVALVDGVALPDGESAALWRAFSEHMDQHQGDLAGFAKARGYVSVKPEFRRGQAVLVVATR